MFDDTTQETPTPVEEKEETETQEVEQAAPETQEEEQPAQEPESQEEEKIDYKKELEQERKLREKAESSAQYHKEKAKELRDSKEEEPSEEDTPLTKKDLDTLEANLTRKTFQNQVRSEASRIATNEDEAELIIFHYENSVVPTGDIVKDVTRARLIANEARIERNTEELTAALESKNSRSFGGSSGGRKLADPTKEPPLDADTKQLVDMNKMKWDPKMGHWANERGVTMDVEGNVTDPRQQ